MSSHRTQITLSEEQYRLLKTEAQRTGASLSELIRQAVTARYRRSPAHLSAALDRSFGAWKGRDFDGEEYVERLRRPGLGQRLRDLGAA